MKLKSVSINTNSPVNNKNIWNNFVKICDMGTVFQSYEWSIENKRHGWLHNLLILKEKENILGGAMLYWKKFPFLNRKVFKTTYGPIWKDNNKNTLDILCEELIKTVEKRKAISLEFQVYLPEYINGILTEEYLYVNDILLSKGFRRLPERIGTYWINLEKDEKEIFNNLGQNHRRDIRKGIREGIQIKVTDNPYIIDKFYEYYSNLYHYKKLIPLPKEFFDKGLKSLLKTNKCKLFYAEYEGIIYNMAIICLFGNPMYVWGASIRSEKKPPTGQLLHWEIIKWLKYNNYHIYDLGGSPGEIPQKEHPNYWVWRFKKRFNGDYIEFLPHYEYIFNQSLYWLYKKVLPIYRRYLVSINSG